MHVTRVAHAAAISVALFAPRVAEAAPPTKNECAAAHVEAQKLRNAGNLLEARTKLLVCSNAACPDAFVAECVPWLTEIEHALPSLVFEARLPDGSDAIDVRVTVDGAPAADKLDGRTFAVNPGDHIIRFIPRAGAPAVERHVVAAEGEKARVVRVELSSAPEGGPPARPPSPEPTRSTTLPAYVVAGAGVVALGGFAYFALTGLSAEHDLRDCSPSCPPSRVDPVRRDYVAADVFLGVGVAALVVAAILVLVPRTD
jgi:hypothetical protein